MIQRIFTLRTRYQDLLMQQRAQLMLYVFVPGAVLATLFALVHLVGSVVGFSSGLTGQRGLSLVAALLLVALYFLVQRGYARLAAVLVIGFGLFATIQPVLADLTSYAVYPIAVPLVSAGLFLRWQGTLVTSLVVLFSLLVGYLIQPPITGADGENIVLAAFLTTFMVTVALTMLLLAFGLGLEAVSASVSRSLERSNRVLEKINFSAIDAPPQTIIAEAINLTYDALDYDVVRVHIVDSTGDIARRYASGLNRNQVLVDDNVGDQPEISLSQALQTQKTQFINLTTDFAGRGHLVAGMSIGLAVPVQFDNEVLGILDVQREDNRPITADEQRMTEFVAAQFGRALAEARLYGDLSQRLDNQMRSSEQRRQQLQALAQAEQASIANAWAMYMEQRGDGVVGYDLVSPSEAPVLSEKMSAEVREALQAEEISIEVDGNLQRVHVPIQLRGQRIGAMSFTVPIEKQLLGNNQQDLIENVVQRLSLALENKRLFEETQARARREREANAVGSTLLSTTDVESVLRFAADSFNQSLGAVQTQIHINPAGIQTSEDVQ